MLSSISLKGVASYDADGILLAGLSKINFIYGANGSGKTTVSNFLMGESPERYQSCSATWHGGQPLDILVYNKIFRDRNFGRATIEGVFTLGQSTAEELAVIERKKAELEVLRLEGVSKSATVDKLSADIADAEYLYKERFWSAFYKKYEIQFRPAFVGSAQKESFKARLLGCLPPDEKIFLEDLEKRHL